MTEQQIDLQERELDYWMTRAYEAEGKLWKAEARIKAVRDIHPRSWHGELDYCRLCVEEEGAIWPCATIRALDG